jgi:hypothetical protein
MAERRCALGARTPWYRTKCRLGRGTRATSNIVNIETTKPKDLLVIHHTIERWITCLIYDGVLERFQQSPYLTVLQKMWFISLIFKL